MLESGQAWAVQLADGDSQAHLEWHGLSPVTAYAGHPNGGLPRAVAWGHYEQSCRVTGDLHVGGRRIAFDGLRPARPLVGAPPLGRAPPVALGHRLPRRRPRLQPLRGPRAQRGHVDQRLRARPRRRRVRRGLGPRAGALRRRRRRAATASSSSSATARRSRSPASGPGFSIPVRPAPDQPVTVHETPMRLRAADGTEGYGDLRAPRHRVRLTAGDGLDAVAGLAGRAPRRRVARHRRTLVGGRRCPPALRAGVGHEGAHRRRGARGHPGGDRRPRRAGRPAGIDRPAAPVPRLRAALRGRRRRSPRRASVASTATPPSRCWARSSPSARACPPSTTCGRPCCVPLGMSATDMGDSPAHGASSTVTDLLRLGGELLTPGRVLEPAVHAEMITPQLPDLAGVLPGFGRQDPNPWGLGFEIRDHKAPALDAARRVAAHLRPLRPVRRLPLGRPRRGRGLRGALGGAVRRLGPGGLARPRLRRPRGGAS